MPDPKTSCTRKPWYQRAMEMATRWKTSLAKSTEIPATTPRIAANANLLRTTVSNSKSKNVTEWRTINTKSSETNTNRERLKKCSSLRVATSFTRVCLCAPISSYDEVFRADHVQPRRSNSYPRSKPIFPTSVTPRPAERTLSARLSMEGRRIFRGKSLTDDVLMRRFVLEEEAMMQVRRRNEMEVIRRRQMMRRKKLGPSPLSRMVLAEEEEC